jgi:hypothetical protein
MATKSTIKNDIEEIADPKQTPHAAAKPRSSTKGSQPSNDQRKDDLLAEQVAAERDQNAAESKSDRARVGTAPEAADSDTPGVKTHILREDLSKANETREESGPIPTPDPEPESEIDKIRDEIKKLEGELKGKSVTELRQLHQDALWAESELKRELYVLRQRAANMSSDAEAKYEEEIIELKAKLHEAYIWLKALEVKLFGETKDISGITY